MNLLKKILLPEGFKKRGSAYFRVYGDVLQIVKKEYERRHSYFEICIGLFSMYDELDVYDFTSIGCVPRYSVMLFIGRESPIIGYNVKDGVRRIPPVIMSMEEQAVLLKQKGIPFLNRCDTQSQMIDSLLFLETCHPRRSVYWPDLQKFPPYLFMKDWYHAEMVLSIILEQHMINTGISSKIYMENSEGKRIYLDEYLKSLALFQEMRLRRGEPVELDGMEIDILENLRRVRQKDELWRCEWLEKNYKKNCRLAKLLIHYRP